MSLQFPGQHPLLQVKQGLPVFIVLFAVCLFLQFGHFFQNFGSQKVLEAWGDGLKTYTNTIYHIEHDQSYHWFEGMNYPYGEHIVPATELPGFAIVLRWLKPIFPDIAEVVPGLLHLELVLSLLLCGIFLFLIFRNLKLPFWYATVAAIGITLLSPQNLRLSAHFGLAQPFVIPMVLYLLLKFEQKPSFKISLWLGLGLLLTSFLHFYFLGINVLLISLYFLFRWLSQNFRSPSTPFSDSPFVRYAIKMIPHYFLMVGIPFLFFFFWMMSRDPVTDRSPYPYGFLVYISDWRGILTTLSNPFWNWVKEHLFSFQQAPFEGRNYIGLGALIFLAGSPFYLLKHRLQNRPYFFSLFKNDFLKAGFWTAVVLLLFSFGYPFIFSPFEFLMDYVGPLRQFRSLGRFAWVFYYFINLAAFWSFYQMIKASSNRNRFLAMFLVFGLLYFDAYHLMIGKNYSLEKVDYWSKGPSFTSIDTVDFSKYQASVPVPYYNIASNYMDKSPTGFCLQKSAVLSFQTGLPSTGSMLTRNGIQQTYNQWQLVLPPYREPQIFQDLPNQKPFLLLWFNNPKEDYRPLYGHLLDGARLVFENNQLQLYETELDDFRKRISGQVEAVKNSIAADSLYLLRGFKSTDSLDNFIYESFDTQQADRTYFSAGAFSGGLEEPQVLYEGEIPNGNPNIQYALQLWAYLGDYDLSYSKITLEERDVKGKNLQKLQFHIWPNVYTLDTNGWGLIHFTFQPKGKNSQLKLSFEGNTPRDQRKQQFDELLIKPVGKDLYQETGAYWRKNNLFFQK